MPTQCFPRELILERYGVVTGFLPAPPDNEISRGLPAGRVTDDTDQAVMLAELLIAGRGRVDPIQLADRFLAWQRKMQSAGSEDLLGPSTIRALTAVAAGASPDESGRWGDTNGAAMRIAPVGIMTTPQAPAIVDAVVAASYVTHNTHVAIAGASAVAAMVSCGIDGLDWHDSLDLALEAADLGQTRGFYTPAPDLVARIDWALDLVATTDEATALDSLTRLIGTSVATQESVPAAFGLAQLYRADPWLACRQAASIGGDCDTIAAMVGAMLGSHHGASAFDPRQREKLYDANPALELESLADALLELRGAS